MTMIKFISFEASSIFKGIRITSQYGVLRLARNISNSVRRACFHRDNPYRSRQIKQILKSPSPIKPSQQALFPTFPNQALVFYP